MPQLVQGDSAKGGQHTRDVKKDENDQPDAREGGYRKLFHNTLLLEVWIIIIMKQKLFQCFFGKIFSKKVLTRHKKSNIINKSRKRAISSVG